MSDEQPEWRAVIGYEGLYEVSSHGDVRSIAKGCGRGIKKQRLTGHTQLDGRRTIVLYNSPAKPRAFKIHALVLIAFVGPRPALMECCHNDGDSSNNRLENLRWDTHTGNEADKLTHNTRLRGEAIGGSRLISEDVLRMRDMRACGATYQSIADWFLIPMSTAVAAINRVNWRHV